MNQYKINELIEKAMWHTNSKTGEVYRTHFEFEKRFAELIIDECIKIVEPTDHHYAFPNSYLGGADGIDQLNYKVKEIKRHFGIE